jgi:hypothetical protein
MKHHSFPRRRREKKEKRTVEEIMDEIFPNLMKEKLNGVQGRRIQRDPH